MNRATVVEDERVVYQGTCNKKRIIDDISFFFCIFLKKFYYFLNFLSDVVHNPCSSLSPS